MGDIMSAKPNQQGGTTEQMPGANAGSEREHLGARIKLLRAERRLSQDRLAIEANVDQSGLSKFERGREYKIGRPGLERIAQKLGMSFEELVEGTDFE